MAHIILRKYRETEDAEWKLTGVQSPAYYKGKDIEDIKKRAAEFSSKDNLCRFDIVEIPDEIGEAFDFLLGENGYENVPSMQAVRDEIESVRRILDNVRDDVSDLEDATRSAIQRFDELNSSH